MTLEFSEMRISQKTQAKAIPCLRAKEANVTVCGRQAPNSVKESFLSLGHFVQSL